MDEIKEFIATYGRYPFINQLPLYKYCCENPHDDFMVNGLLKIVKSKDPFGAGLVFDDKLATTKFEDIKSYVSFIMTTNNPALGMLLEPAIKKNNYEIIQCFIDNNYNFNNTIIIRDLDFFLDHTTPLSYAIFFRKTEIIEMLLETNKVNIVNKDFVSAFFSPDNTILSYLLENNQMYQYFQEHKQSILYDICDCSVYTFAHVHRNNYVLDCDLIIQNIKLLMDYELEIDLLKLRIVKLPFKFLVFLIENSNPCDHNDILKNIILEIDRTDINVKKKLNSHLCYQLLDYYLSNDYMLNDFIKRNLVLKYPNVYSLLVKYNVDLSFINDEASSDKTQLVEQLEECGLTAKTLACILLHDDYTQKN